jgi:outer membrane protein insertion porin family
MITSKEKDALGKQGNKLINMLKMQRFILAVLAAAFSFTISAQSNTGLGSQKEYTIKSIRVSGVQFLQPGPIVKLSGLKEGDKIKIPGPEIGQAIDRLWRQGLFSDANIYAEAIGEEGISLVIYLSERPRVGDINITGLRKSKREDIVELTDMRRGSQVTANNVANAERKIKSMYIDKGFLNAGVTTIQQPDTILKNITNITFEIEKGKRVKIEDITFSGANELKPRKMRRAMKETKRRTWYNIFKRSKYVPDNYKEDKALLVTKFKEKGYRDIEILSDSVFEINEKRVGIHININEGKKYYFRDISWVGNTKYNTQVLDRLLGIKKGDVYNESQLEERIYGMEGVSSIYLDNGYLFFNADPVEINVSNDSIDIEIRIYEGRQATISNIIVTGNTKTNDHVIRREIRTKPGELFSRADIIRTQRELAQLGYFNPESMSVNPYPDPERATVDIEYVLEETSSDQIELSGGWSGKYVVGSVRLVLNNFSTRNFFNKSEWKPIPSGDGQKLSLSVTVNPLHYESYNVTFTEPWLGGKKPNSLTVAAYHSVRKNGLLKKHDNYGRMIVTGASVGLGRRASWPDDYFSLYNAINFQQYDIKNYNLYTHVGIITEPLISRNISITNEIRRNSVDQPIYPRSGSMFSLGLEITPPYSLFDSNKKANGASMSMSEKYDWIEYHKWTFKSDHYTNLIDKFVLRTRVQFGFLGYYQKEFHSPFEKFDVGGSGMSGAASLYGSEVVSLRGYEEGELNRDGGSNLYDKFSLELRYPFILSPSATIYGLVFAEAGNAWNKFSEFNPFDAKRAVGGGIRLFLPMFGLIGFDYGHSFDTNPDYKYYTKPGTFHFILGQEF